MKTIGDNDKREYTKDGKPVYVGIQCVGGGRSFRYTVDERGMPDLIVDVKDTVDSDGVPYGSEENCDKPRFNSPGYGRVEHRSSDTGYRSSGDVIGWDRNHEPVIEDDPCHPQSFSGYMPSGAEEFNTVAELHAEIKRLRNEIAQLMALPADMLDPDREWKKRNPRFGTIDATPKDEYEV